MKKNIPMIKNNKAESITALQDENARKLLASKARLLALNAVFDAALSGESARHMAKNIISVSDNNMGDRLMKNFLDEENPTEH